MHEALHSISTFDIMKTSGSTPVLVLANDLNYYFCKYHPKNVLVNEFLAYKFLEIWGFDVFPVAFVKISTEHIPYDLIPTQIQPRFFDWPSFGLQQQQDILDVNNILAGPKLSSFIKKFDSRFDLLKIGLFDLWLANNDRHEGNYNLLIKSKSFYPIDHADIFDGRRLGQPLVQQTEEESLLNSQLVRRFLNNKRKNRDMVSLLIREFPSFVLKCGENLESIIQEIPEQWCTDKEDLKDQVLSSVINNDQWLKETLNTFKIYLLNITRQI